MSADAADLAIQVDHLSYRYGRSDAVNDLTLRVPAGRCYGLFGRNGAGKTTTLKCLLGLLRPAAGTVRVFGLDPARDEVAIKSRVAYVPDQVAFYPWMRVRGALDYLASFRPRWDREAERRLLDQLRLDEDRKVDALSRGERTQLALTAAICSAPDLLVLDEPTSGLDPIVRRELIQTIIGAYQDADPGRRTVLVSTHLISELEGLIDEFAVIDAGRVVVSMEADEARARYRRISARFPGEAPAVDLPGVLRAKRSGRQLELTVNGAHDEVMERLKALSPEAIASESLTLEEVFLVAAAGRAEVR